MNKIRRNQLKAEFNVYIPTFRDQKGVGKEKLFLEGLVSKLEAQGYARIDSTLEEHSLYKNESGDIFVVPEDLRGKIWYHGQSQESDENTLDLVIKSVKRSEAKHCLNGYVGVPVSYTLAYFGLAALAVKAISLIAEGPNEGILGLAAVPLVGLIALAAPYLVKKKEAVSKCFPGLIDIVSKGENLNDPELIKYYQDKFSAGYNALEMISTTKGEPR